MSVRHGAVGHGVMSASHKTSCYKPDRVEMPQDARTATRSVVG